MSRVIKSAIMHGNPKILENPAICLPVVQVEEETVTELDPLEKYLLMMEEQKKKAARVLEDAEQERLAILENGNRQVQEMLMAAQVEAEQLKASAAEEGKKAGYQSGHDSGYEDGSAKGYGDGLEKAAEEMKQAVHEANQKAERTIAAAENDTKDAIIKAESKIVEIALAIADKVLPQHFIDAPQIILPLVRSALEKVKDQNSIVIRVSPDDYELVLMAKNEFQMILEGDEKLTITEDQTIAKGGCMIESANGNVDARLTTQLNTLKKAIQEVI